MNDLHAAADAAARHMGELGASDGFGSDSAILIVMMVLLAILALAPLATTPRRR